MTRDPGPITDFGSQSGWIRLIGEGQPTDYSAGASFDEDFRGTPHLRVVPTASEPVQEALQRPQAPDPGDMRVSATGWAHGRYGHDVTRPDGTFTWVDEPPPPIDGARGEYLAAKSIRERGREGLLALRDAMKGKP